MLVGVGIEICAFTVQQSQSAKADSLCSCRPAHRVYTKQQAQNTRMSDTLGHTRTHAGTHMNAHTNKHARTHAHLHTYGTHIRMTGNLSILLIVMLAPAAPRVLCPRAKSAQESCAALSIRPPVAVAALEEARL